MKVKVIKAGLSSYWYANRIGQEYDVVEIKLDNCSNLEYKVIGSELVGTKYFDKDDVEIINEEKGMKKSDLKTGMRVVHGKHPRETGMSIVVNDLGKVLFRGGSYNFLSTYGNDLKSGGVWDITAVYDVPERDVLNFDVCGDLIWQRVDKTPEQVELDKLMSQIQALQDQAEKLQAIVGK